MYDYSYYISLPGISSGFAINGNVFGFRNCFEFSKSTKRGNMVELTQAEYWIPDYLKRSEQILLTVLDVEGKIEFSNYKFQEEVLGNKRKSDGYFWDTLYATTGSTVQTALMELFESPMKVHSFRLLHQKDLLVSWEFSLLNTDEGDLIGIMGIGILMDLPVDSLLDHKTHFPNITLGGKPKKEIYFHLNESWLICDLNKLAIEFFDAPKQDLYQKSIWKVFRDSSIFRFAHEFKMAKEKGERVIFEEFQPKSETWFRVEVVPVGNSLKVFMRDITGEQIWKEKFQQSQLDIHSILEQSDESFIVLGLDQRVINFNTHAERNIQTLFGKKLIPHDKILHVLLPELEQRLPALTKELSSGKGMKFEGKNILTPDGRLLRLSHKFYPLFNPSEKLIGMVYCFKNLDAETVTAEEKNRILHEIAFIQSHLLRSPLSSMMGLLELIDKNQLDKENRKLFSYLKPLAQEMDMVIRNNAKRANQFD